MINHLECMSQACVHYFLTDFNFPTTFFFFISSKKLFLFSKYPNFCNFLPAFPHLPDSKIEMEVEKLMMS